MKLKLESIGYTVEFTGQDFKVGCQTLSWEDSQKLTKFIQEQELKPKRTYRIGQKFRNETDKYILAYSGNNKVLLVNLLTGNRYSLPITVESQYNITEGEFIQITSGHCADFTPITD